MSTCPAGQVGISTFPEGECSVKNAIGNMADSSNCTTCPPNTYTFGNQLECYNCPAGKAIPADIDIGPATFIANPVHHFSPDACAIDIDVSPVGTCSDDVGPQAQEYALANGEKG